MRRARGELPVLRPMRRFEASRMGGPEPICETDGRAAGLAVMALKVAAGRRLLRCTPWGVQHQFLNRKLPFMIGAASGGCEVTEWIYPAKRLSCASLLLVHHTFTRLIILQWRVQRLGSISWELPGQTLTRSGCSLTYLLYLIGMRTFPTMMWLSFSRTQTATIRYAHS